MARRLGYPSVRHLTDEGLSATELMELLAAESLDPPVGDRIDAWFAQLISLVYNRTRGKNDRPLDPADIMPKWGVPPDEVREERLQRKIAAFKRGYRHGNG